MSNSNFLAFSVNDLSKKYRNLLVVANNEAKGKLITKQLKLLNKDKKVLFLNNWDCSPYDFFSPSVLAMGKRIDTLGNLLEFNDNIILVLSFESLIQLLPPPVVFFGERVDIEINKNISRKKLTSFLNSGGFKRVTTVYEAGEFSVRGDIIDLYPATFKMPIRIDFFGDEVEKIRVFDPLTQKTVGTVKKISVRPVSEVILSKQSIEIFGEKFLENFGSVKKNSFYESIINGKSYRGQEHWLSFFYDKLVSVIDYLPKDIQTIFDDQVKTNIENYQNSIQKIYHNKISLVDKSDSQVIFFPTPDKLYWQEKDFEFFLQKQNIIETEKNDKEYRLISDLTEIRNLDKPQIIKKFLHDKKKIFIACNSEGIRQKVENFLKDYSINYTNCESINHSSNKSDLVFLTIFPLESGFCEGDKVIFSDQDLFGKRISKKIIKSKKSEEFFQEASQLKIGDFVVHSEHGIGQYKGLETINIDGFLHDCLLLLYDNGDKLYLPVENLELLTRYGNENVNAVIDKLGTSNWQHRKARIKNKIKEVAEYLIKIATNRTINKSKPMHLHPAKFEKFSKGFNYPETDDQIRSIEDVVSDLTSGKLMDRLICGDVGFGKTEIALRTAFMAVDNGKQVVVLVPTTLLARQHFQNFQQRFRDFPYKICQLSRMVKPKDAQIIKKEVEEGKVDIVIGTHAVISEDIKFNNLGLVIVDEEQHFGVKQKERLKKISSNVHVLTLTATPIPRTLQMSLSGVRDLSLITTPPFSRIPVRNFVIDYDLLVIKEVVEREINRGGQIFFVTPRIEFLNQLSEDLQKIIPNAKIGIANGKMPIKDLEDVMTGFYDFKFDVLLATNIIESGIDVPTANTLIVHRSDLFGLSQLYQLRGRVGRSKLQAYAYFMVDNMQTISANSQKRLDILKKLDHLGAGFSLASYDLDIRGAGNIVGEEQSGHIKEVGVELYQKLLHDAVNLIKTGTQEVDITEQDWSVQIQIGVSVFIPDTYVEDLNLRLNLYQRISKLENRQDVEDFAVELIDRFGKIPQEVKNLLEIVALKQVCKKAHIAKLETGEKGLTISFHNDKFPKPESIMDFVQSDEAKIFGNVKLRADQKLVFLYPKDLNSVINYSFNIVNKIYEIIKK